MCSHETEPTHFLNVDFDLESERGIAELMEALGRKVIVLCQTDTLASFELCREHESVEACLSKFASAIECLPPSARSIWDGCARRTANVGIQAGLQPRSAEFSISRPVIMAFAAIGCDLTFTIYAPLPKPDRASAATSS